jgi:hypothetical protein
MRIGMLAYITIPVADLSLWAYYMTQLQRPLISVNDPR